MKVLLVHPPLTMSPEVCPPLGLCVLASHLRDSEHTVSILDLDLEEKSGSHSPDQYLQTFQSTLDERRPEIVGFTSMFNNSLHAERLIRATKCFDSGIVTVAGGSHFGALPRQSLDRIPELDFAIRREGETAFAQLLRALGEGAGAEDTPGLCYRSAAGVVENPAGPLLRLQSVQPVWVGLDGVLDLRRYVATIPADSPRRSVYIEAGRGCPFDCSFCATAPFWERRYRVKSIDCIIAEIRHLYEEYRYDTFMLVHDLLTADKHFISDFCDALFSARLPVEWTANHRADIQLGALAPKMRSAGCLSVFMGIESASDRIQREVSKGLTRAEVMSTVQSLLEVGVSSTCSFILGFPSETATDLSATLELAGRLKMIGAEPVQVHRLRMWPPAPLAAQGLPASFDLEALRLEFPSDVVADEDIRTIQSDQNFFMGYFTPDSLAGSSYQLAQLELLFANLLAALPITAAAFGVTYRDQLVPAYYRALAQQNPISRADLASISSLRETLVPYLSEWIEHDSLLTEWQRRLLQGVLSYEAVRIGFMAKLDNGYETAIASGANWVVFPTGIDIVELLKRLAAGSELTPELCAQGYIAMTVASDGAVRGFALAEESLERLRQGDPSLLSVLTDAAIPNNLWVAAEQSN